MESLKKIAVFFDKLENRIRETLSKNKILYGFIAAIGVVLFWRGIWHTADMIPFLNGPVSTIIGGIMLLATGLLVASFLGEQMLLSDVSKEEKKVGLTEKEVKTEKEMLEHLDIELHEIEKKVEKIEYEITK